jgi:uncharacterized protein
MRKGKESWTAHPGTASILRMETIRGIAIVTGASSGIGAAFARRLAKGKLPRGLPGFDELWLVARRADRLDTLAAELRTMAPQLRVKTIATDLSGTGNMERLAVETACTGVPVSILVNNAGYGTYGDFTSVDMDRQLGQIDLNCRALTESCWRFAPLLDRGSVVINVASLAAFAPLGGFAVYAATKAYALSLSVGIAAEWKHRGIKVCALCPGSVQSEFALVASAGARTEVKHGWSADKTVDTCLRDAGRGRAISMPRVLWRLSRFAGWLVGPELSAAFAYRFMKKPSGGEVEANRT